MANPANVTLGYLEWRDTVPELYAANDRLMGGLAAERTRTRP